MAQVGVITFFLSSALACSTSGMQGFTYYRAKVTQELTNKTSATVFENKSVNTSLTRVNNQNWRKNLKGKIRRQNHDKSSNITRKQRMTKCGG